MKVLVSGDRGYVGAVLVPLLLAAGHEVVGLDTGWYDGCDFGPYRLDYESRTGDIRDAVPADLRGVDAVVHLAAISNDPIGHLNPETTYSVNAYGAAHLAEAARAAGVGRFLFSSSCSLYGAAGDAPVTEESATNPVTPYGESKILAEQLLARVLRDVAELVVGVGDDAAMIRRRDDRRLVEGVADLVQTLERLGHRRGRRAPWGCAVHHCGVRSNFSIR